MCNNVALSSILASSVTPVILNYFFLDVPLGPLEPLFLLTTLQICPFAGIPGTLNYIPLDAPYESSPKLIPYPSWQANELGNCASGLTTVYRIKADQCDRLWVLDVGTYGYCEYFNKTDKLTRGEDLHIMLPDIKVAIYLHFISTP